MQATPGGEVRLDALMLSATVVGHADMTLRELTNLMAQNGVSSVPIVERTAAQRVLSVVATDQILEARLRDVDEEHRSERVLNPLQL